MRPAAEVNGLALPNDRGAAFLCGILPQGVFSGIGLAVRAALELKTHLL